jgi:hypothetical protein
MPHSPFPALAAAEVIARRMPFFWSTESARQAELTRMVTEKNAALMEGVVAANFRLGFEMMNVWGKAMTGGLTHHAARRAGERVAAAALAPAAKRVKANRTRLRRAKS